MIEQLKNLVIARLTSNAISHILGLSRCSIVSKVKRIGMQLSSPAAEQRRSPSIKHVVPRMITPKMITPKMATLPKNLPPKLRPEPYSPQNSFDSSGIVGKSIMELENHDCRWPYGKERVEFFCGKKKWSLSSPYCEVHTRIAWRYGEPS